MPVIDVTTFTGMRPAVAGHLLEQNEAQSAFNVDTSTGVLSPVYASRLEAQYPFIAGSLFRHDARASGKGLVWRVYPDKRQFVESPVAGDPHSRLYMSSPNGLRFIDGHGNEYALGIKVPEKAPRIGDAGQRGGPVSFDAETKTMTFTSTDRAACPYLTPGGKVVFSGMPPSPLAAGTTYSVLEGVPDGQGGHRYRLGNPASSSPNTPIAFADGTAQCSVAYEGRQQNRVYVFTVVNSYGDESAPSLPASVTTDISCNQRILDLVYAPAAGEAPLAKKRIYRLATGENGNSDYLFVAEIDGGLTEFTDNRLDVELAESLPSLNWRQPDPGLRHVASLPGGVLAAHTAGGVYLSESYKPYAWPEAHNYTFQGRIQTIAVSQRTLFALTESVVHALTVDDPASAFATTLDGYAPCLSADGTVTSPLGVLFPSSDGLYLVSQGMTSPQNVTDGLISDREWHDLNPSSFFAVFYDTTYLAFYRRLNGEYGTLMLDFGKNGQARMRLMDEWGMAIVVVPGGRKIYYAKQIGNTGESGLYEMFGNEDAPYIATWRSKEFVFPTPVNMAAAIVESEGDEIDGGEEEILFWGGAVGDQMSGEIPFGDEDSDVYPGGTPISSVLRVFADGKLRATLYVKPNRFMRLPQGYAARRWEFEITTLKPVKRIAIGTAIEELR